MNLRGKKAGIFIFNIVDYLKNSYICYIDQFLLAFLKKSFEDPANCRK